MFSPPEEMAFNEEPPQRAKELFLGLQKPAFFGGL